MMKCRGMGAAMRKLGGGMMQARRPPRGPSRPSRKPEAPPPSPLPGMDEVRTAYKGGSMKPVAMKEGKMVERKAYGKMVKRKMKGKSC